MSWHLFALLFMVLIGLSDAYTGNETLLRVWEGTLRALGEAIDRVESLDVFRWITLKCDNTAEDALFARVCADTPHELTVLTLYETSPIWRYECITRSMRCECDGVLHSAFRHMRHRIDPWMFLNPDYVQFVCKSHNEEIE